ncbi:hypothetical protein C8J57DRAFT_1705169 [Mycena rebaudengoi]|nr:hypothetical protein C8J57DRAFT_1705169 [Mycena rebaudengoi]
MPPPAPSATTDGQHKRKRKHKWKNGCGARVHGEAVPVSARFGAGAGGLGTGAGGIGFGLGGGTGWRAPRAGVEGTVVPLEARYFSREARAALRLGAAGDDGEGGDGRRRDVCGCCVQGVGCAVCGNPLGALRTLCAVHAPSSTRHGLPSARQDGRGHTPPSARQDGASAAISVADVRAADVPPPLAPLSDDDSDSDMRTDEAHTDNADEVGDIEIPPVLAEADRPPPLASPSTLGDDDILDLRDRGGDTPTPSALLPAPVAPRALDEQNAPPPVSDIAPPPLEDATPLPHTPVREDVPPPALTAAQALATLGVRSDADALAAWLGGERAMPAREEVAHEDVPPLALTAWLGVEAWLGDDSDARAREDVPPPALTAAQLGERSPSEADALVARLAAWAGRASAAVVSEEEMAPGTDGVEGGGGDEASHEADYFVFLADAVSPSVPVSVQEVARPPFQPRHRTLPRFVNWTMPLDRAEGASSARAADSAGTAASTLSTRPPAHSLQDARDVMLRELAAAEMRERGATGSELGGEDAGPSTPVASVSGGQQDADDSDTISRGWDLVYGVFDWPAPIPVEADAWPAPSTRTPRAPPSLRRTATRPAPAHVEADAWPAPSTRTPRAPPPLRRTATRPDDTGAPPEAPGPLFTRAPRASPPLRRTATRPDDARAPPEAPGPLFTRTPRAPPPLSRTAARPDLHDAATSLGRRVERRAAAAPGASAAATPGASAAANPQARPLREAQSPAVRFPSAHEQEAWLAAGQQVLPDLRRRSLPDLRPPGVRGARRVSGPGASVSAAGASASAAGGVSPTEEGGGGDGGVEGWDDSAGDGDSDGGETVRRAADDDNAGLGELEWARVVERAAAADEQRRRREESEEIVRELRRMVEDDDSEAETWAPGRTGGEHDAQPVLPQREPVIPGRVFWFER